MAMTGAGTAGGSGWASPRCAELDGPVDVEGLGVGHCFGGHGGQIHCRVQRPQPVLIFDQAP